MTKPNSPFAEDKIPEIAFDIAEVMEKWYKCECDGHRTYYANKAAKFFQKKLKSLFQEIEEKVLRDVSRGFYVAENVDEADFINPVLAQRREALKSIEERWF